MLEFDYLDTQFASEVTLSFSLRVSLEEQRQRQEEENKGEEGGAIETATPQLPDPSNVDLSQLSEEEQIALAMQMSLAVSVPIS